MRTEKKTEQILQRIRDAEKPAVVSIDGRCAAGKSTLAEKLSGELNAVLIHMDDFYLRPEQRTEQRYQQPGGNVDAERFLQEILIPLREGREFEYRPFDCQKMMLSDSAERISPGDVAIIEGSYSQRDDLSGYYDLKIFLDVSPEKQMERIRKRNPQKAEMFENKWIPLEERYFTLCHIKDKADLVIDTTDLF